MNTMLLESYLTPTQATQLTNTGTLPADECHRVARKLQQELVAVSGYIPNSIVRSQLAQPEPARIRGEFWHGSILFADLTGFTSFCDRLSVLGKQGAEEVSTTINKLFSSLLEEVFRYNGELIKFGGDALMAFFDAKKLPTHHALAAVHAALAMQRCMQSFMAVQTRAGTFRLMICIGVNSGTFFAAEVGNAAHIEVVLSGEAVHCVAHAQTIASPGEVIVSSQTAHLIPHASIQEKTAGFYMVQSVPDITMPLIQTRCSITKTGTIDMLIRMVRQIEALRPYLVHGLPRRFLDSTAGEIGEFRPVSIVFINLCGFQGLLAFFAEHVPRAIRALNAYVSRMQDIVHQYEGIINKIDIHTHTEKIMVLFGAPGVHENDPVRAVRCALDMTHALDEANKEIALLVEEVAHHDATMKLPAPLHHCIGINTGTVYAGRVGGIHRYEYTVMGPPVNLAARLMEVAAPSTILIAPNTYAAVERDIACIKQPPVWVKGLQEPVVPMRVLGEHDMPQLPSPVGTQRPPMVGREADMTRILQQAHAALCGEGRLCVVSGEVGVGKTRLIEEMVRTLILQSVDHQHTHHVPQFSIYTGEGQTFKHNVPYITIRAALFHMLGFNMHQAKIEETMDNHHIEQHLHQQLERLAPQYAHVAPLLGDVLGIPLAETPVTQTLSSEQRYQRIQEVIVAVMMRSAHNEPLLLILEDMQWADASSRDVIRRLLAHIETVPLFIVMSYRSDTTIPEQWHTMPHTNHIELSELSREQSHALLAALLQGSPPDDILALLDQTQGNPFFIEELVHALSVSGTLIKNTTGIWCLSRPLNQVAIPTNIEGLIMARLDRLDEAHYEILQVASVIGKQFSLDILQGVYPHPTTLYQALQLLEEQTIISADEQQAQHQYQFRHSLLHNVVYESILYAHRRELHARVAQRIEELHIGQLDENVTILGRHYLLAEKWEPAFHYHLAAGIEAQKRHANHEALSLFATAQDAAMQWEQTLLQQCITNTPYDVERRTKERRYTAAHTTLGEDGRLLVWTGTEWIRDRRRSNRRKILVDNVIILHGNYHAMVPFLLHVIDLHEHNGNVCVLLGHYSDAQIAYQQALNTIERLHHKAGEWYPKVSTTPTIATHTTTDTSSLLVQLDIIRVRLHRFMAAVYEHLSDYDEAFVWLHHGMEYANEHTREELARCYLMGAQIYYHRGEYDQSLEWVQLGFSIAELLGNIADQAHALLLMGNLWRDRGEFELSIPVLEQARTLLDQIKDASQLGLAFKSLGDTYWRIGRWNNAMKNYHKSLQIYENIGDVMGMAHASSSLATVMVARGDLSLAADLYQYSSQQFQRIGSLRGLAVTGYRHGEVLLLQGTPREALHLLRASITSLERIYARNHLVEALNLAAEASLLLEDSDAATQYIAHSLVLAHELGLAVDEAIAYRVHAQIALFHHDVTTAHRHITTSHRLLEQIQNRYEFGKVLLWQGIIAWSLHDHQQTVTALSTAHTIFSELHAKRELAVVQQRLHDYGLQAQIEHIT